MGIRFKNYNLGYRIVSFALDECTKDKLITEDEQKDIEKDIQKLTDDFVAKIGKMVEEKKNEIMDI